MKVKDEAEEKNQFKKNILSAEKLNENWGLGELGQRQQDPEPGGQVPSAARPQPLMSSVTLGRAPHLSELLPAPLENDTVGQRGLQSPPAILTVCDKDLYKSLLSWRQP